MRLPGWLATAGIALLLVGCGSSGGHNDAGGGASSATPGSRVTVSTLAANMRSAIRSARSVHISGRLIVGGRPLRLDIGVLASGQLSGTVTERGVPLRIIVTGGKAYVRATAAFLAELHAPAGVCGVICGKYVELPAGQATALARGLSLASLTRSLTGPTSALRRAGTTTVDGQPADVLRTARGGTIDVAAAGRAYPLAVASADHHGGLAFRQWDSVPAPAAPPKTQIVNLGNLG
jgi:hypothetical protein